MRACCSFKQNPHSFCCEAILALFILVTPRLSVQSVLFVAAKQFDVGGYPSRVDAGHFNADGVPDSVVGGAFQSARNKTERVPNYWCRSVQGRREVHRPTRYRGQGALT
jgi:hypothetical protein